MTLNQSDKINYLRGLILLVCKDKNIDKASTEIIHNLADVFGFNHYFVDSTINEIINHNYILEEPPEFSKEEIAEIFIRDATQLAFIDSKSHIYEWKWVSRFASKNKLSSLWLIFEIVHLSKKNNINTKSSLEIQKYIEQVFN